MPELREVIKECSVKGMKFLSDVWDCDNSALRLHSNVQKYQYDLLQLTTMIKKHYSWAFGEAMGIKFRGEKVNHAVNICVTDKGIFLIEPQSNQIWKAKRNLDVVYFVKF